MTKIENLEKEISQIKERNSHVEFDKAWETSLSRKALLIIFTYLAISLYMKAINIDKPWLNAIIPALGFLLSTLTLSFFKKLWAKYFFKK